MQSKNERIPIGDVAKMMKTTPLNVLMHIKRGLLKGEEEDGVWLVERQSLEALLAKTDGHNVTDVCASGCAKRHSCGTGCR